MSDLELFLAVIARLWWLWLILLGGMVGCMFAEYREYVKEDESK